MQMNQNTLIYAFAGVAALVAYKALKPAGAAGTGIFDVLTGQRKASGAAVPQNTAKISEVLDGSGGNFSNGWRYFTDGTSIGPDGKYYFQGEEIWSPV